MKKINSIICIALFLVLTSQFVSAQITHPQIGDLKGINYQAVAIDENGKQIVGMDIAGKPLYEKNIGVRFSILKGSSGTVQYQETHTALTDRYGLFSLVIGAGTQTDAGQYSTLMTIPWIDADQWLEVEIATKNDGDYKLVSLQQFMTVPYSFYTDDIADDAITTWKISDGTILNQDIANGTINLTTKVTGILPVPNGGTGVASSTNGGILLGGGTGPITALGVATNGQLPIGDGTTAPVLNTLTAGTGIVITNSPGGITITSSVVGGVNSSSAGNVNVGATGNSTCGGERFIGAGLTWISPAIPLAGVELGNIVVGSINYSLQGCQMTTYVNGSNNIRVAIFNGTGASVCFPFGLELRVLVVQ